MNGGQSKIRYKLPLQETGEYDEEIFRLNMFPNKPNISFPIVKIENFTKQYRYYITCMTNIAFFIF